MGFELDYDAMIDLDAEALAEGGIREAYEALLPALQVHVKTPDPITETLDADAPRYSVHHRGVEYVIYGPEVEDDDGRSWANAAYALFRIVNLQLEGTPYRLYAINGGNDLGGMFLKPEHCKAACESLESKSDWPYIPTQEPPWYGAHH